MSKIIKVAEEIKRIKEELGRIEYQQINGNPYLPDYVFLNTRKKVLIEELEKYETMSDFMDKMIAEEENVD